MSFRNPMALLVLAGVIPPVVLFYFLKLKRDRKEWSSTYLWKRAVQDLRVNAPFQRLRKNILLLLQLLFLALAGVAAADPVLTDQGVRARQVVLVIDRSASMGARMADGRSRLDVAKDRSLALLEGLGRDDRAAAIAFDQGATTLRTMTRDIASVRRAVRELEPTDLPSDAREALTTADAIMHEAGADTEVYLVSDGAVSGIEEVEITQGRVFYLRTGEPGPNLGIVGIEIRRSVDALAGDELFVAVANGSPPPGPEEEATVGRATLEVRIDGELYDARTVEVEAGKRTGVVFELGEEGGVVEARLEPRGPDILEADDVARAVLPERRRIDVLVVSSTGNYFVQRLLSLDPTVLRGEDGEVPRSPTGPDPGERHDVVVWDRVAPEGELPPGGHLLLGELPPLPGWESSGTVEEPSLIDWDRSHPVTRFAPLRNLSVAEALDVQVPEGTRRLVTTDRGGLVFATESEAHRLVVVGFDVFRSDWPLQVSFPVMLTNAIRWLAGRFEARRTLDTGELLVLSTQAERGRPVAVLHPAGEEVDLPSDEDQREVYFGHTRRAGVYRIRYDTGAVVPYAFSLANGAETAVTPAEEISFRTSEVETVGADLATDRPIWRWLAVLGVAILLLEWWIYNRRVHV